MTSELLLMALNVIKEYCTDHADKEQTCKSCVLHDVCEDVFAVDPLDWEMELVKK